MSCVIFWVVQQSTRKTKHRVIEKIVVQQGAGRIIRNFLFVIADHHRAHMLPEIIAAVQDVVRQRQGIAEAEVSSAVELSGGAKNGAGQNT